STRCSTSRAATSPTPTSIRGSPCPIRSSGGCAPSTVCCACATWPRPTSAAADLPAVGDQHPGGRGGRQQAAAVLGEQASLEEGDAPAEPADASLGEHPAGPDLLQGAHLDLQARHARLATGVVDDGVRHGWCDTGGS